MIRLMLVDDHEMIREALKSKFEQTPDIRVVADAGTVAGLFRALSRVAVDIVVLDIRLPDGNGLSAIRRIKKALPGCRVVILTMFNNTRYAVHAIETGANGFLVKGAAFDEFVRAIRAVHAGGVYVCSDLAAQIRSRLRGPRAGTTDNLSQREFETVMLLGGGLSLKETAERMGVRDKTVSTYRTRAMEKLDLRNHTDLVRYVMENGIVE